MSTKWMAVLMLLVLPLAISAKVFHVPQQFPTVHEAVMVAVDGDTLVVPEEIYNSSSFTLEGKELVVIVDAIEPSDAPFDSTIYGPREPFPATPLE